jgi:oxygen-dependent protoporphyrinogen oxidase
VGVESAAPNAAGVVVVGAGICGLATALELHRAGVPVTLLEAAELPGGALRSRSDGDWLFELGPNTVLARPAVKRLLAGAGLEGDVVTAGPRLRRWLWKGERLQALPGGPGGLLRTKIVPARAKLALLREPFVPRAPDSPEESIAAFVRRRLGEDWLAAVVGPMVSGIYAGDPERLSVRWALPRLHALEREHGSLLRGAIAGRGGAPIGGALLGFRGGFQRLAQRLAAQLPDVRLGLPVLGIEARGRRFHLATVDGVLETARLVLAVPAAVTAELLAPATGGASTPLAEVRSAPVVVACLGYRREAVRHPLDGFGFLAARAESLRTLGCLFSSSLFPGRAPAGHVALTAFAGGTLDPELAAAPDEEVWRVVEGDVSRALGIEGPPAYRYLRRWPRAIPQYEVGHGRFADLAGELERRLPGLLLAGSWLGGASVPDSITRGVAVAGRLLAPAVDPGTGGAGADGAEQVAAG